MTVTHVMSGVDARGCFPEWRHWMPNDGVEGQLNPPRVTWLVVAEPLKCERCKGDGTNFAGPNGHATHLIPCVNCNGTGLPDVQIVSDERINDRPPMEPWVHGVVTIGAAVPIRSTHPTSPMIAEYLLSFVALERTVQDWTKSLGNDITNEFGRQPLTGWAHKITNTTTKEQS